MNPKEIKAALIRRDEAVLEAVKRRYGAYIRKTAFAVLRSEQDAEEVENTVYLKMWRSEAEALPEDLKGYLGMLSRQTAIDQLRRISAARRGSREYETALDELSEVLPDPGNGDPADRLALKEAMSAFLKSLRARDRQLFLCRYWYAMSIRECMENFGMKESAVKTALHRMREKLREQLKNEGIPL